MTNQGNQNSNSKGGFRPGPLIIGLLFLSITGYLIYLAITNSKKTSLITGELNRIFNIIPKTIFEQPGFNFTYDGSGFGYNSWGARIVPDVHPTSFDDAQNFINKLHTDTSENDFLGQLLKYTKTYIEKIPEAQRSAEMITLLDEMNKSKIVQNLDLGDVGSKIGTLHMCMVFCGLSAVVIGFFGLLCILANCKSLVPKAIISTTTDSKTPTNNKALNT